MFFVLKNRPVDLVVHPPDALRPLPGLQRVHRKLQQNNEVMGAHCIHSRCRSMKGNSWLPLSHQQGPEWVWNKKSRKQRWQSPPQTLANDIIKNYLRKDEVWWGITCNKSLGGLICKIYHKLAFSGPCPWPGMEKIKGGETGMEFSATRGVRQTQTLRRDEGWQWGRCLGGRGRIRCGLRE